MTKPKVQLIGQDGNVFNLIALCRRALRKEGYDQEDIQKFTQEVTDSDSYDEALAIMHDWFDIE